jgi:hypothetical protein
VKKTTAAAAPAETGSFVISPKAEAEPSALIDTVRTATIEIRGESKTLSYDLSELTPRLRRMLTRTEDKDDSDAAVCEFIRTVVTRWDITDRQGEAVPITAEGVSDLSYRTINSIMEALNGDPNEPGADDQTGESPA